MFTAVLFRVTKGGSVIQELACMQETHVRSLSWTIPCRREWLLTPVFLPKEFHGQRSLAGYNPRGDKKSDKTEWLTFLFHFSILSLQVSAGGHGNPLRYSCLGNTMDREAWWATVHRVTKESDMTERVHTHHTPHTHTHTHTHTHRLLDRLMAPFVL